MDSYAFHDSNMVFRAPVQRRQADAHAARVVGEHPTAALPGPLRRVVGGSNQQAFAPLPAFPTMLGENRFRIKTEPSMHQYDHYKQEEMHHSAMRAPAVRRTPNFPMPTFPRSAVEELNEPSTKTSLGFILSSSRSHQMDRSAPLRVREDDYGPPVHKLAPQIRARFAAEHQLGRGSPLSAGSSPSYISSPSPVSSVVTPSAEDAIVAPVEKKKRKARICTAEGCTKYVVDHGLCIRHGGGKRCYIDGCNCRAQNRGLCWKHGGFTICKVEGCTKRAKSRGICWSHGGGTRCKRDDCSKIAVSNGLCWAHGGGKRCVHDNCRKPASERTNNLCNEHYARTEGDGQAAEL